MSKKHLKPVTNTVLLCSMTFDWLPNKLLNIKKVCRKNSFLAPMARSRQSDIFEREMLPRNVACSTVVPVEGLGANGLMMRLVVLKTIRFAF